MDTGKYKLHANEHFILRNLIKRLPQYVFMWMASIVVAIICTRIPWEQPVIDYSGMRAFSVAFITIATTTITFAIPTCMRTIFSAYEDYYSTKIKQILLQRFPVTLLALSAFTSLILSIFIVSGLVGIAIPTDPQISFYVALFWTLVCVFYLFVAIEKMVYFIVNAPYAVLDKLEYGLFSHKRLDSREQYNEFRVELSSMNDIASTIISRSTGQDTAITSVLDTFRAVHKYYLQSANHENPEQFKLHISACRAVDHEMVRIFRTAATAKNEQACKTILRIYCQMLADAFFMKTGIGYFADMMEQIARMQSYAAASAVDEIRVSAYIEWFYMLSEAIANHSIQNAEYDKAKYTLIVRALSTTLRRSVMESDDAIIYRFMRIASNADMEYDIEQLNRAWASLLDRAVFVFITWLLDAMPDNASVFLDYIRRYSAFTSPVYRSVMPDTVERVQALVEYEGMAAPSSSNISQDTGKIVESSDSTALAMSISLEDTAAHVLAMLAIMDHACIASNKACEFGRAGRKLDKEFKTLASKSNDEQFMQRVELAKIIDPEVEQHINKATTKQA